MNRAKNSLKYVGMDVHRDCIAIAVLNQEGRQVCQSIVPTERAAILEFIQGLRGSSRLLHFERLGPLICCGRVKSRGAGPSFVGAAQPLPIPKISRKQDQFGAVLTYQIKNVRFS
jgi:hypothetical protein